MRFVTLAAILFSIASHAQHVPSFEEVISLRNAGGVVISPDGAAVAFTVQTTDWDNNRYDTEIWISRNQEQPFQLTNTPSGNSTNPEFSPDGKWLAFLADRGNKNQIFLINLHGGEAHAVTAEEDGISDFDWHPSGERFIVLKEDPDKKKKDIEKRYGSFETDDQVFNMSHLWEIEFKPELLNPSEVPCYETVDSLKANAGCIALPKAKRITEGKFTVTSFSVSPDGNQIAYNHQPDPLINSSRLADISVIDLATRRTTLIVGNKSTDVLEHWSPDSNALLFSTALNDSTSYYYINAKLFIVDLATKKVRQLAADLDEDLGNFVWTKTGIYGAVWNKMVRPMYRIDPATGRYSPFAESPHLIMSFDFSADGSKFALAGRNHDQLNEIFVSSQSTTTVGKLSNFTGQISGWNVAQSEIISWKSKDGATIEGVLHKPKNYDPSKKYPLLVVVHGGPTGIDTPQPVPNYVYPIVQWLDKGCLVLRPNYRGSAGYGEKFRSLNVKNLGVGDAWDVLSGVDYLDKKGFIDKTRMGCMGWSQGGYISAFLTTNSTVFKAISVGAGISNWMTYYVNTDIHPFTQQYLKATPWSDESVYRKTSPMTNITKARTPTLIQHGENDKRVPIANAYELLQGLRDNHVPSELIVYKGFGHGISKPRERLAANWHNWQWFNKYIWNETVELPVGKPSKEEKKSSE